MTKTLRKKTLKKVTKNMFKKFLFLVVVFLNVKHLHKVWVLKELNRHFVLNVFFACEAGIVFDILPEGQVRFRHFTRGGTPIRPSVNFFSQREVFTNTSFIDFFGGSLLSSKNQNQSYISTPPCGCGRTYCNPRVN